ncbi:hypothetical protein TVAG_308860 [Trichomonas vaginalis G3]|uniref:Uncharacterized protein n=2 Tax=Trichomonas vaginalis (strain ATCC PRA-98 / G3) TaxID=412133 RepID=A2EDN2_TRIV3|nr:hypothetical protein TVAG_308860 [Trichomonas vaginalis G3]|eukprot:XP_001321420.1 hypothetical protein [Trichomonas vaginalis G3]
MRQYYQTGNLTEQDVVTVTPSSRYDVGDKLGYKTSVDTILGHPITNFSGRFVSGRKDPSQNITIDFHAVQIQIESYTFYWTTERYMRGWNFYGVAPTGLELLSSPAFPSFTGETFNFPNDPRCDASTKYCNYTSYFHVNVDKIGTYSKFVILNTHDNSINIDPVNAVGMAKILVYGEVKGGLAFRSPIKLKRKEQLLFNFGMFSSMT